MVRVSGFTIIKNAIRHDFPVEASIRSVLPVCDEVVVNVGPSDDGTLDLIESISDPKIRIIEGVWDITRKNWMLSDETLRAMRACAHPWGIYIQGDEVLHERGAATLLAAIQQVDADPVVEALLVKYLHFYGDFNTIASNRRWYRREIRALRLDPALDIRPFKGAQGFRVGPDNRKTRARLTTAEMFHYGWARPAAALRAKAATSRAMYPWSAEREARRPLLPWIPGLRPFTGTHPAVAGPYIAARTSDPERVVEPARFEMNHLRFYASDIIERLTGARVFEYRNYRLV
jgi:hypothetical protein